MPLGYKDLLKCRNRSRWTYISVHVEFEQGGNKLKAGTYTDKNAEEYLAIRMYAHENGCPWDAITCDRAAVRRDLEMLTYAHENGFAETS
jgi:hypothetical protein